MFLRLPILSIAIDCISPVDQGEGDSKQWDNFYLCKVTVNTVLRRKMKVMYDIPINVATLKILVA